MTKSNSQSLRAAILTAARAAGVANANQFAVFCRPLGFTRSHAIRFYQGRSDISTARADLILQRLNIYLVKN